MLSEKIFCGLDIGSSQMKASVVKSRYGKTQLLSVFHLPTAGLKDGIVNDLARVSECIHQVLTGASKKAGVKFKGVRLGVGGSLIHGQFSKAMIPLVDKANKVITSSDIRKVNKQACVLGIKIEEEILHDFPQYYVVDDTNKVVHPAGLYGRKLAVGSLLITVSSQAVGNIVKAVNQASYEADHVFFSSFEAAQAVLTKDAMHQGSLLVDMGAATTNLLFLKDGFLKSLDVLRHGGDRLTEAIAQGLGLPMDLAEDIKKSHGAVLGDNVKSMDEILIKKDSGYTAVSQKLVCEAMDPEVTKFADAIKNALQFSHIKGKLAAGIFITGGTSLLPGLLEKMEKVLGIQVATATPLIGYGGIGGASLFNGSIGLAQSGFQAASGKVTPINSPKNWIEGVSHKVRELYEEYF